jgi:hypothetical protein
LVRLVQVKMIRAVRALALGAVALVATSCTGSAGTQDGARRLEAPGRGADRAGPSAGPVTYTCAVKPRGDGPGWDEAPADWRARSDLVGPLGFLDVWPYADLPPALFAPQHGTTDALLFTVVVEAGAVATLVIPEPARSSVLLVDLVVPPDDPPFDLADGVAAIRFEACPDRDTPFAPAMLAMGAQCVPINVFTSEAIAPLRTTMSFGAGRCAEEGDVSRASSRSSLGDAPRRARSPWR